MVTVRRVSLRSRARTVHSHLKRSGSFSLKWLIALGIVGAHVFAIGELVALRLQGPAAASEVSEVPIQLSGFVVDDQRIRDTVPVPELKLIQPRAALDSIRMVRFTSADWGDISGVTASASAPQLSRFQPVDPAVFARRAGLSEGQVASLVLAVEVLPDGRTGTVWMARGSGNPAADEAAVAYVRQLRWIPGTRDHHAEVMRINLPVTLVWQA